MYAKQTIAVVGLGYVGLAVAAEVASKNEFTVIGIDKDINKINLTNKGKYFSTGKEPGLNELLNKVVKKKKLLASSDFSLIQNSDLVIFCINTPLKENHKPNLAFLLSAIESAIPYIRKKSLISIESTIPPGTMKNQIVPLILKNSKFKLGSEIFLVHVPERVRPGWLLKQLRTEPRVIGAYNSTSYLNARKFYKKITTGNLDGLSLTGAEIVKTGENAYRDVQIAFANQMALICEKYNVNVFQIRNLINKTKFRHMHLPGAGVGGHCIPKDPWLLVNNYEKEKLNLIPTSRRINDYMPHHIVIQINRICEKNNITPKIGVMGLAFVEDSDDYRNSPSIYLINDLIKKKIPFLSYDPFVQISMYHSTSLKNILNKCNILVFMTAHHQFQSISMSCFKEKIIIDGRNIFNEKIISKYCLKYYGIGKNSI